MRPRHRHRHWHLGDRLWSVTSSFNHRIYCADKQTADQHPESKVIGIDLSPIQPMLQVDFTNRSQEIATERPSELTFNYDSVPPNLRFYVDNVELPWTFSETFDFIHCRMMTGAIKDWPKLFENCFQYVFQILLLDPLSEVSILILAAYLEIWPLGVGSSSPTLSSPP